MSAQAVDVVARGLNSVARGLKAPAPGVCQAVGPTLDDSVWLRLMASLCGALGRAMHVMPVARVRLCRRSGVSRAGGRTGAALRGNAGSGRGVTRAGLLGFATVASVFLPLWCFPQNPPAPPPDTLDRGFGAAPAAGVPDVLPPQAPTATPLAAVHPDVRLRVDSAAMLLGSPNRLTVTGPAGLSSVDFRGLPEEMVAFADPTDSLFDGRRVWSLPFSVYDSAGLTVSGLPVVVDGDTYRTNDLALVVTFPALDTAIVRYRGIYAERATLRDYAGWIALAAGAVLLGVVALWYYRSRRPEPVLAKAPPTPPADLALARLRALRARGDLGDEAFYTALDRTLRVYLEDRFGLPALERTSAEVAALLRARDLPDEGLRPLLDRVDLAKFARAAVPAEARLAHLAEVEAFVERTRRPPETPPA